MQNNGRLLILIIMTAMLSKIPMAYSNQDDLDQEIIDNLDLAQDYQLADNLELVDNYDVLLTTTPAETDRDEGEIDENN
ncbi:MAG: hypothetical protein PHV60_01875 [bacterium]|nr:hypothetical protein [bacterium]